MTNTRAIDKELSIIIVNWKSCEYLKNCLESIYRCANTLELEVIVVDNASYDGSAQLVKTEFPQALFIQCEQNVGFSGANNIGFERSSGRSILFLNPDTEVIGNALTRMTSVLQSRRDAGIVGVRLLNSDSTLQSTCVMPFPSIWNELLNTEALRRQFPRASIWGTSALYEDATEPIQVSAISGACLMIKRQIFADVQMFSSDYFMYSEDLDLCYKVAEGGWRAYYVGDATVIHHGGGSSGVRADNNYSSIMMRESLRTFFRIHRGRFYARVYQITVGISAICRLIVLSGILVLTLGQVRSQYLQIALERWLRVFKWSIGLEQWTKKQFV